MEKTIFLGDTHGRSFWKLIIQMEKPDRVVFIGDYFDTHEDISPVEQLHNFREIIQYKIDHPEIEVILLIGNHDWHYFPEIGHNGTSGYQSGAASNFEFTIKENREYLQMAYGLDNILCTHAGVGEAWMERIVKKGLTDKLPDFTAIEIAKWVNQAYVESWSFKDTGRPYSVFNFTGRDSYGDDMGQTPIWIRPRSFMKDSQVLKQNGIIQIVGHTQQNQIDIKGNATGGKYYFIDTLGISGEYLIYQDGKFSVNSVKNGTN